MQAESDFLKSSLEIAKHVNLRNLEGLLLYFGKMNSQQIKNMLTDIQEKIESQSSISFNDSAVEWMINLLLTYYGISNFQFQEKRFLLSLINPEMSIESIYKLRMDDKALFTSLHEEFRQFIQNHASCFYLNYGRDSFDIIDDLTPIQDFLNSEDRFTIFSLPSAYSGQNWVTAYQKKNCLVFDSLLKYANNVIIDERFHLEGSEAISSDILPWASIASYEKTGKYFTVPGSNSIAHDVLNRISNESHLSVNPKQLLHNSLPYLSSEILHLQDLSPFETFLQNPILTVSDADRIQDSDFIYSYLLFI